MNETRIDEDGVWTRTSEYGWALTTPSVKFEAERENAPVRPRVPSLDERVAALEAQVRDLTALVAEGARA